MNNYCLWLVPVFPGNDGVLIPGNPGMRMARNLERPGMKTLNWIHINQWKLSVCIWNATRNTPKSASFNSPIWLTRRFCGFKSRWSTRRLWQYAKPRRIWNRNSCQTRHTASFVNYTWQKFIKKPRQHVLCLALVIYFPSQNMANIGNVV